MIYSLDTNTCIRYLNGRSPSVVTRLRSVPAGDVVVCSVVRGELWHGAAKSQSPQRSRQKQDSFLQPYQTLPFDDSAASEYARIRAELERAGMPIGPLDMAIAAIALANDLILVTHNIREFSRVSGLKYEDWQTD